MILVAVRAFASLLLLILTNSPTIEAPTMMANRWRISGAALLVFCTIVSIISPPFEQPSPYYSDALRRNLRRRNEDSDSDASIYGWASELLNPVTTTPKPSDETVLFWHVPKSGGTNAKSLYGCLHLNIAGRAGVLPRFGHENDEELMVFQPWKRKNFEGPSFVNVDVSTKTGILHAKEWELVPSGLADIIFTPFIDFATAQLYDPSHKGRAIGLFRHPIDRLVSKFYYLQTA